jgi:MoCo/4Fe-4S cofactor protein with predicted Tat translocation signal
MDTAKVPAGKCGAEPSRVEESRLDLAEVREKLRQSRGPELWRSLDELAATPRFQDMLHREFPRHAAEWRDDDGGVSRRNFLQLAGASLALAGLTGCTRQPLDKIVPYVQQPEEVVPGRPLYFATTLTHAGYGMGVVAESHEGRPTKIEGNPAHPASLGSTDLFAQAAVLTLYDPQRSQVVVHHDRAGSWGGFVGELEKVARARAAQGGEGVRVLSGTVTSPTFAAQMQEIARVYPRARWHRWEPAGPHQTRAGAARAFGRPLDVRYDFSRANVVLALDSDFLSCGPAGVAYSRAFAARRRVRADNLNMNRLYAVESTPSGTGALADHRLALPPAEIEAFLAALAQALGAAGAGTAAGALADPTAKRWVEAVAQDLKANAGAAVVVVDEGMSPAAHVLGHAVNQALGAFGTTVSFAEPAEADPVDHLKSLAELVADMNAGRVELLLMLDGVNPVYTAPADLAFADALAKVKVRVHHGLYEDETSARCHWHIPAAHELESWGDARGFDGTASLRQPLIEPLYGGRSALALLGVLLGTTDTSDYEMVRNYWRSRLPAPSAAPGVLATPASPADTAAPSDPQEAAWRQALNDGVIPGTQQPALAPLVPLAPLAPNAAGLNAAAVTQALAEIAAAAAPGAGGQITLTFRPDPTLFDGRYAENVWLQELPKPITKLSWDNALLLSPATAHRLQLGIEQRVQVSHRGRKLDCAVWVLPGQARDTATLTLGGGRQHAGERGSGHGFNAYVLRASDALWMAPGVGLQGQEGLYTLACTQNHHVLNRSGGLSEVELAGKEEQERHVVRTGTLAELKKNRDLVHEGAESADRDMTLYPNREYKGHKWGMGIDLNVCTACSACVVACQAENNIPVVGKEQVLKGREMHWIRIDRYFTGDMEQPGIHHQPVPCMQCENAPCEQVCPVAATVHSDEGLNDMVYNRCVGTRYCSNNCPYKVRRFNFLRYSEPSNPALALLQNPEVTVRTRGVMEKCTYCVQRIERAKIDSKVSGKPIAEAQLKTACQQACPTEAIVFGDLNQHDQQVAKWQADPLNYALLEELNTRPRTTYIAKLSNPNPLLSGSGADAKEPA